MLQLRYIPRKGPNSHFFLPHPDQVPPGEARGLSFPFPTVPALGTATYDIGLTEDIVITSILGVVQINGTVCQGGVPVILPYRGIYRGGFSLLFYHTHDGIQRQWQPQGMHYGLTCGIAAQPNFLRRPYLMEKGDTITCEVANISTNTLYGNGQTIFAPAAIYVALDGVHPE